MQRTTCALLAILPTAFGQTRSLTLREALDLSGGRDPQQLSDSLGAEAASLQESQLKASWMPSVTVQGSYNRVSEVDGSGVVIPFPAAMGGPKTVEISPQIPDQWGLVARVDQQVWEGGRTAHLAAAARLDARASRASRSRSGRDLSLRVSAAYWNLAAARATLESAKRALERADSQAVLSIAAYRQGTAPEQDTLQARLRERQIELSVEQAAAARDNFRQSLCVSAGLPADQDLSPSDPLVPLATVPAGAVSEPPEVEQARLQSESAAEQSGASRAALWPVVAASAEYDLMDPNPRVVPSHDKFDGTWRVGATATWNLWRGGADDLSIRRSALLARQARLRQVAVSDAASLEVARRETDWKLARRRREIATANLPLARRDLELARLRADAGTGLRLDAIDRAAALAQAESDLASAVAQENIAATRLQVARGQDPTWN